VNAKGVNTTTATALIDPTMTIKPLSATRFADKPLDSGGHR
jgi:hypothetical protein